MLRQHKTSTALIALVLGLALVWGCSDDDNPTDPGGGGGGEDGTGTISGVVASAGGFGFSGATVSAGQRSTSTNEDGYFILTGVAEGSVLVSVASEDYVTNYRMTSVIEGATTHLPDLVLQPYQVVTVDGAAGGSASTGGGLGEVEFAPSSFVDGAGNPYTGDVTVSLNALAPQDNEFYGSFPGEFSGVREDDSEVPFVSYGIMTVELSTPDKAPLELAPGTTATMRLTIDETKAASAPATIPMWWFDEEAGVWREEGEATLEGNVYSGDVAHFTTWNWDLPVEDICSIAGIVLDENEQPVMNARVISRGLDQAIMDEVFTDAGGAFEVRAVRSSQTELRAIKGSLASDPVIANVGEDCPFPLGDPLVLTVPAYSISLTWDELPDDLDSHLLVPMNWDQQYDYYHIYYSSMGTLGEDPYAVLDTDDTDSFGPEIITGTRLYDGRFQYWVHNYATDDSEDLAGSGAMVQLEIGGQLRNYDVADVPLDDADTTGWWHVFDLLIDGTSITVEPVMRFQPEFSDDGVYADKSAARVK